jgi:hypothetical protein
MFVWSIYFYSTAEIAPFTFRREIPQIQQRPPFIPPISNTMVRRNPPRAARKIATYEEGEINKAINAAGTAPPTKPTKRKRKKTPATKKDPAAKKDPHATEANIKKTRTSRVSKSETLKPQSKQSTSVKSGGEITKGGEAVKASLKSSGTEIEPATESEGEPEPEPKKTKATPKKRLKQPPRK